MSCSSSFRPLGAGKSVGSGGMNSSSSQQHVAALLLQHQQQPQLARGCSRLRRKAHSRGVVQCQALLVPSPHPSLPLQQQPCTAAVLPCAGGWVRPPQQHSSPPQRRAAIIAAGGCAFQRRAVLVGEAAAAYWPGLHCRACPPASQPATRPTRGHTAAAAPPPARQPASQPYLPRSTPCRPRPRGCCCLQAGAGAQSCPHSRSRGLLLLLTRTTRGLI